MALLASQLKVAHTVECHHRDLGIGLVTDSAWVEEGSSPALDDGRGTEQRLEMTIPHRIQVGHAGDGPVASQWVNARGWTERVGGMTLSDHHDVDRGLDGNGKNGSRMDA